jgi:hypothetical protein
VNKSNQGSDNIEDHVDYDYDDYDDYDDKYDYYDCYDSEDYDDSDDYYGEPYIDKFNGIVGYYRERIDGKTVLVSSFV